MNVLMIIVILKKDVTSFLLIVTMIMLALMIVAMKNSVANTLNITVTTTIIVPMIAVRLMKDVNMKL